MGRTVEYCAGLIVAICVVVVCVVWSGALVDIMPGRPRNAKLNDPRCAAGALQFRRQDCPNAKSLMWVGDPSYGGWKMCLRNVRALSQTQRRLMVVYGFNIKTDTSWDEALIYEYGIPVHAFDPTQKSVNWVKARAQLQTPMFIHSEVGLGDRDRTEVWNVPLEGVSNSKYNHQNSNVSAEVQVKHLRSIMAELGHTYIDILKVDVEGAEYEVLIELLENGCLPTNQLLMETHSYQVKELAAAHIRTVTLLKDAGFTLVDSGSGKHEHTWVRFTS
ncbi:Methyltransferase-like protein 24 [Porphyridium purpureum]|uniref:Methyltransferase-like protein 24 n=1 Tax=Porphyridium purpureum TaxID=35688 RepID=A0A5J4YNQ8_PORPP|nr:Methyltransferase-like protein 24 [Porphyridium purpureum]|eukprot:POR0666..scf295_9